MRRVQFAVVAALVCSVFFSCSWYANPITDGLHASGKKTSLGINEGNPASQGGSGSVPAGPNPSLGPVKNPNAIYFLLSSPGEEPEIKFLPNNHACAVSYLNLNKLNDNPIIIKIHNPKKLQLFVECNVNKSSILKSDSPITKETVKENISLISDSNFSSVIIEFLNDKGLVDKIKKNKLEVKVCFNIRVLCENGSSTVLEDDEHPVILNLWYAGIEVNDK